jgi:hypothetical protein
MICVAIGFVLLIIIGWLIYEVKNTSVMDKDITYTRIIISNDNETEVKDDIRQND